MLKIRLKRIGRRHDPQFRVVVTDARNGTSAQEKEIVGSYNAKMGNIELDAERITYWIGVGAQASDTVHNMLVKQGIVKGKTRNALPKKTPIVSEVAEEAAAPAPAESPAPGDAPAEGVVAEEAPVETPAEENNTETPEKETASEAPAEEGSAPVVDTPDPQEDPTEESATPADDTKEQEPAV